MVIACEGAFSGNSLCEGIFSGNKSEWDQFHGMVNHSLNMAAVSFVLKILSLNMAAVSFVLKILSDSSSCV